MEKAWARCAVAAVAALALAAGTAAPALAGEPGWDGAAERRHSFFLSFGAGPTRARADDHEREVEGITFQFTTEGEDLGLVGSAGWWINDHVGLELSYWSFGGVTVPFTFQDPHDNTSGTGESEVSFSGPSISLLFGQDVGDVQLFGRIGAINWAREMDSRFDIEGEPALHRKLGTTGSGLTFGAGVVWRFHRGWGLQAQYERTSFDSDTIDLLTLGLQYDFLGFEPPVRR